MQSSIQSLIAQILNPAGPRPGPETPHTAQSKSFTLAQVVHLPNPPEHAAESVACSDSDGLAPLAPPQKTPRCCACRR